eukprot:scaffold1052_cov339-Pavlova_lutheri.AAC.12
MAVPNPRDPSCHTQVALPTPESAPSHRSFRCVWIDRRGCGTRRFANGGCPTVPGRESSRGVDGCEWVPLGKGDLAGTRRAMCRRNFKA